MGQMFKKIHQYGELVMFSHTLFSLPFALIAMLWAAEGIPDFWTVAWVLMALIAGRNGANAFNRWVDRDIDKANPRTQKRHLPSGIIKSNEALGLSLILFVVFVIAAYQINTLCFLLSPIALLLFILYSYTKRFTWTCHIILGITCAGAPLGAWLAIREQVQLVPLILSAIVVFWISGFDIIYGTQDIEFDRKNDIFSIPARFGLKGSLLIARSFHFFVVMLLLGLYFIQGLGFYYLIGLLISIVLFCLEHYAIEPKNKSKMDLASYRFNQYISMTLLIFTYLDFYIGK